MKDNLCNKMHVHPLHTVQFMCTGAEWRPALPIVVMYEGSFSRTGAVSPL